MKIKGNVFIKIFRTSFVILAFMLFTNNMNASSNSNAISTNLNQLTLSTYFSSANTYALTWWYWWKKKKRCYYCYSYYCYSYSCKKKEGGGDSVPLDGGLSILLLGAAAFGIKKLRNKKE